MFYVVGDSWTEMSLVVTGLSISFGGSRVFGVSYGVVDLLLGLMARSISEIAYGGVTSMCGVTSMSSSSWVCGGS